MRQVTATEKYRAVNEGRMAKGEFVRQMRLAYPSAISQWSSYTDTVQILKNKGFISEITEADKSNSKQDLNISLSSIERGVRYELQGQGIDPTEALAHRDEQLLSKIEDKVVKNLKKDPLYYINLLAKESSHVDKNDEMKETKRGAEDKDTFNGMKKAELKEEVEEIDVAGHDIRHSDEKQNIIHVAREIRVAYGDIPGFNGLLKDFLHTHMDDVKSGAITDPVGEFDNFVDANYDRLDEKKADKDYDGDGKIESGEEEYRGSKDKAIKAGMGNESQLKEAVKSIIKKVLSEEVVNEAATAKLSQYGEEYADFEGVKQIINQLENIVTEVESFYDRVNNKVKDIFAKVGEVKNEEGLKVGGFIAPSIEAAFRNDLRPVQKNFLVGIELPKVKTISQADIARVNAGGELEEEPKQNVFSPVYESKKKK